ncbi:MAG: UvrD-helicase domain-containing protein [Eggerthellaceae bacterium]|nr:UvrD-helicase domain-containing protein [Eggerthellaceae bacterium]
MDFSRFTEEQKECVKHLDGPLFIAAGAGSGKTFTLQNRIAWALMEESGSGIRSIEEVLAITFTEKATAEIKARVRSALREAGMTEEALKVDSAWISTIHGMCSRILHEHALEAGIDPSFTVLSDFDSAKLREDVIEEVLAAEKDLEEFGALFAEYGVRGTSSMDIAVYEMLKTILGKAASFSRGLDAISLGPKPLGARAIATRLRECFRQANDYGSALVNPKKQQVYLNQALALCEQSLEALDTFIAKHGQKASAQRAEAAAGAKGAAADEDMRDLAKLMAKLKPIRADAFGRNDPSGYAALVKQELDWALANVNAALARPHAKSLLDLARKVDAAYQAKLDDQSALDNNGLLHRTLAMLTDHPEITESYTERFKLVMVDEFQDTNQMQVDLITRVAGNARLCTVGDAQQSIYRFNGADVSVFEARRKAIQASKDSGENALESKLGQNFRSHGDILAFVRKICGSKRMFGDNFLDLRASRTGAQDRYKGSGPRIELQIVTHDGGKEATGAQTAEAHAIARRFSQLREEGHHAGEMVVLLSKTTNADIYAKALRDEGFECVLEGGKSFFEKEEVQVVVNLLAALANPADSKKLFSVLASPMIHLAADDFLNLTSYLADDGRLKSRSLERGIKAGAPENASPALAHALSMLKRAYKRIKHEAPSRVVMGVLLDSGWLSRLESEGAVGSSQAANILKAVQKIEELEQKPGYRISSIAHDFAHMAKSESEGPGSLSVSNQNAVHIMTIHKSKGLEFPIVAVADFEPSKRSSRHFSLTALEGTVHLALGLRYGAVECASKVSGSYKPEDARLSDGDPARYALAIAEHDWTEELAEAQRKFYVACTRASEFLLVSSLVALAKSTGSIEEDLAKTYASKPILDDVREALCGSFVDFPAENARIEYGGDEPARFTHLYVSKDEPFIVEDEKADRPETIDLPLLSYGAPPTTDTSSIRNGVFSYSSIAPEEDHLPVLEQDDLTTATTPKPASFESEVDTGGDNLLQMNLQDAGAQARSARAEHPENTHGPSATDMGSAFHRVGQLAIERLPLTGGVLEIPPVGAVNSIARSLGLAETHRDRLDAALKRWFNSTVARRVETYARIRAEVPFMVCVSFDEEDASTTCKRFLEGEIDLLAESDETRRALVIDYKTGGSADETNERLQAKHQLQAQCYAYALISSQNYESVEFAFVRVEQSDRTNPREPQVVSYRFDASDLDELEALIVAAYRKKQLT